MALNLGWLRFVKNIMKLVKIYHNAFTGNSVSESMKGEYLCELNCIVFVKQEETYTSKASFWDKDDIPVCNIDNPKEYQFSGKRIHRDMYKTKVDKYLNADVNGALNILRKSSVVDLSILYGRGEVDTPVRIRIA